MSINTKYMLELENVSTNNRKFALKNNNLRLESGYIYCITGENGSGKTTLLRQILDENAKYSGVIKLFGEDIRGRHNIVMKYAGYVSEERVFLEKRTALQNAEILGKLYSEFDIDIFKEYMKIMNTSINTTYYKMSRGEKMKFQLSFAIACQSKIYILDDVTAGMDSVFRAELFDMLRGLLSGECLVIITTHNVSEITRHTDYVAVMENGSLGEFTESIEFGV